MNRPLHTIALLGALAAALPIACTAQAPNAAPILPVPSTAPPAVPMVSGLPDFTNLVQQVGPAVVSISAEIAPRRPVRGQLPDDAEIPEFFRRFFGDEMPVPGPQGPQGPGGPRGGGMSQGTGFLISDDGFVLTNHHVVDGAGTVTVRLSDRREFTAKVVGSDEQSDVALLKIEGKGLPALRTGSSQQLKAGQWVVAIGSPFGLDHSVTAGIVSAVGRANPYANQQYVPFIQTDVAINRGNSGGPLLNTRGEVVGINSQIFSNSGGYMGVSFAIPIDVAMNAVQQLRATGRVSRGQLGVQVQQIDSETARGLGLPDSSGALVADVVAGSAAAKAGIQRMDVIRAVNGQPVNLSSDLPPLVGAMAPGSRAKITVLREGRPRELSVVLGELDGGVAANAGTAPAPDAAPSAPAAANALGLIAQDIAPTERQRLGLQADEGVRLAQVTGESAREAGLRAGDVILSVGRNAVGSAAALNRELAGVKSGQTVMLLVRRGGATQFVAVTAGADVG
ncbi:DegQ family serine endoprotease [Lysobacter koreensis]|uniref:Probable periplasmic serine endoprotease DegP-like n=1 Tax=Lysobacter koreensis TaxID=266122 RepID=A0ABW2YKU3_9GAMM